MKSPAGFPEWQPDKFPITTDALTVWVRDQIQSAFIQFSAGQWETALEEGSDFLGSNFHWLTEATSYGAEPVDIIFTPDDMESALRREIEFCSGTFTTQDDTTRRCAPDTEGSFRALDSKAADNIRNEISRWKTALDNVSKIMESIPVCLDDDDLTANGENRHGNGCGSGNGIG